MIHRLSEVLRSRKNRIELVTKDPVLANFLKEGGDWHCLAKAPEQELRVASGGNNTDWHVEGDVVTLTDQFAAENTCEIKLSVLVDVIVRLGKQRGYDLSW